MNFYLSIYKTPRFCAHALVCFLEAPTFRESQKFECDPSIEHQNIQTTWTEENLNDY